MPLWLLARDRQSHIILAGNKDTYIEQISRACKTRIDMSEDLREAFGLRRGIKWADEEWYIERPDQTDRVPSVLAVGAGAEIQSQRADWLIGDDLCTRRNCRAESQRAAMHSYIETDLGSRIDKTKRPLGYGKMLLYGHRVEANDPHKLREGYVSGPDRWVTKKYQAIVNDTTKEILCPETQDYDTLAAHRSRDVIGFHLMYQQESAQAGTFVTQTSMEKVRRPDLFFHNSRASIKTEDYQFTWMSLDPAFSQNRWSSHAVWELWGMTKDFKHRLLWGFRDKVSPDSLLNISEMKFRLFMPDNFFIESNQGQVLILPYLKKKFPDHQSKFKPVYTVDNDGSKDEEIIKVFEAYSAEQPVREIPFGGPTEQAFAIAMTDEYTSYPQGKRDTLMAEYVGLKGLGLLKNEERKGEIKDRGIMQEIARNYTPNWMNY